MIDILRNSLDNIVHKTLYEYSVLDNDDLKTINDIQNYLNNSKSFIDDLRDIINNRNNENYIMYNKYITSFIINSNDKIKLEFLNKQDDYRDIIKDNNIYLKIFNSLDCQTKLNYLLNKKIFTEVDIDIINNSLKECGSFDDNPLFKEILNSEKIRNKIPNNSINLGYSYTMLSQINLSDYELCKTLTKENYTMLLLKKYKTFSEFKELYLSNKKILNLIEKNGLVFDDDNEDIYNFLIDNPNTIGKFNKKYLDLLGILETTKISKNKDIDSDTYSTIIEKLYEYNKDIKYFNEDSLKKCSIHSLTINPFPNLDSELKNKILNDYNLFNRFTETLMIEIINDSLDEEEILNILRNDNFINDMSSYAISLLLNKLSFKSTFNMLQRENILNKIDNLNVELNNKDIIFFKGFLDSPILVSKSDHNMIYEMLNYLKEDDTLYYITLPYIINKLSNYELINLITNKNISILSVIDIKELDKKLNNNDLINIIDNKSFKYQINLKIFKDKKLTERIFNFSDEQIKDIDFDEVNYLVETIRTKSFLSNLNSKVSVTTYKCVLAAYLTLGLEDTIKLVSLGNQDITLKEVQKLKENIVNERLLQFRENNSSIFQNMNKKITYNLENIGYIKDINDLSNEIRNNTYLDNIIYLMLENNFDTYNNIINKFYNYYLNSKKDSFEAKRDIYDYSQKFIEYYLANIKDNYSKEFDEAILKNFKPKDDILYKKRKEITKEYLNNLKLKLFVKALTDENKEVYKDYFRDNYHILNIKDKYTKYLGNKDLEFNNLVDNILIPMVDNTFNKDNCLSNLGIKKPDNTDEYRKYLDNLNKVDKLNKIITKLKKKYSNTEILSIMNNIIYNKEISFKIKRSLKFTLNKLKNLIKDIDGEIYIDKTNLVFKYQKNIDIYNIDEIKNYLGYLNIIEDIINKTYTYINRNMDNNKIKSLFAHDFFKNANEYKGEFPITDKYYEPKKHVLSLKDIEKAFNGYDITNYHKIDDELKDFLINKKNLIMVIDGYYDGTIDSLGIIISKWNDIINYKRKLNIKDISLLNIYKILNLINEENNILCKSLDNSIIEELYKDNYYEVNDISKRIKILTKLYQDSLKKVQSTIPYLEYKNENYKIKIIDNYDKDILKSISDSVYKVGMIGNDFLHYTILNKNGLQIGIYENDILTAKILGVRNGNTIFLNTLEGLNKIEYHELLRLFSNELIKLTENTIEPIEFVIITNNENYISRSGIKIDNTICPIIDNPINKDNNDYIDFLKNENLLNNMYTNYEDSISTLLASSKEIDKDNFKFYNPTIMYDRIRNDVKKLSNNLGEEYLKEIDKILYLCKIENNDININNIILSKISTIFLGDDYILFITDNDSIMEFVLPYDKRAQKEVNMIKEIIKRN